MKSSLLPVKPGTSSAVPRGAPAGSPRSAANVPRAVLSRTAEAQRGSARKRGVLIGVGSSGSVLGVGAVRCGGAAHEPSGLVGEGVEPTAVPGEPGAANG
ncbi:hypothetical protein GCM10009665_41170 [Kitasatospora nipponensis]|uniref:Uncharacterized protein n=1 Tax=Kitasatospora nipponensis TaxID=258049 RepID=A0ABP4H1C5_9ACTN